ncbi:MAG: hypothetical protein ACFFD4_38795 [Candidatus Odinarchaeota archaeon]
MPLWKKNKKDKEQQPPDVRDLYENFGSGLKKTLENSEIKAEKNLRQGLEKISEDHPSFLPEDVTNRLLTLKTRVQLPPVLFPPSFFEKPRYRGKKEFFEKLANDCVVFGTSYQRSFGKYPKESSFPANFLRNRNWWVCEEEDIQEALKILISNGIITFNKDKLVFEDISFSKGIAEIIKFVSDKPAGSSITLEDLSLEFPQWSLEYLGSLINRLIKEDIAVKDEDGHTIYFKSLY